MENSMVVSQKTKMTQEFQVMDMTQGVWIYTYVLMYVYIYWKKMKILISNNESEIFDCLVRSSSLQPHGL